jgi:hypothetical protein
MPSAKTKIRGVAAVMLLIFGVRLLFLPSERVARDAAVRDAYEDYCACVRVHIFCAPDALCAYTNCMGEFLGRSEEINRKYILLSLLKPRNLLSGWQPYRGSLR